MMRKYFVTCLTAFILLLTACSGSAVYQGNWKATDTDGTRFEIDFSPKSFSITDSAGKVVKYEYTQNSVKIENSVKSYGIRLQDGRTYTIRFPIANETSKGVILLQNNEPAFTICRTSYVEYNDLYKLTQ